MMQDSKASRGKAFADGPVSSLSRVSTQAPWPAEGVEVEDFHCVDDDGEWAGGSAVLGANAEKNMRRRQRVLVMEEGEKRKERMRRRRASIDGSTSSIRRQGKGSSGGGGVDGGGQGGGRR